MATPNPLVLLVEDDQDLRVTTRLVLERHEFEVVVAGDGIEALAAIGRERFDAAVVDVVMPRMDGITLIRKVRAISALPIVVLTARDLPHDQISALESGADDYVTKPFDGEVLAARLRALLRRTTKDGAGASGVLVGDLVVDRAGMTVIRAGEPIELSATEFRMLATFLDHPGIVLDREQLLEHVWGSREWGDPRVVDVNIQRLRVKIGADKITTMRGVGYKWALAPAKHAWAGS